jgi:diaminobutyrate-2-oxoglutarate transaminase
MSKYLTIFDENESEAKSYCRRFPRVFVKANGSTMIDVDGNQYLDFLACAGSLNYGHNPPVLKQALAAYLQVDGIVGALDFHTEEKAKFIQSFVECILEPRKLDYRLQFTAPTGTSVIESAVKLARKVSKRKMIISFTNGYHGMSGTSLGLTGHEYHRQDVQDPYVIRMPYDNYFGADFDTIASMRKLLNDPSSGIEKPAAVVLETVQGEGGVNIASAQWLRELRTLTLELGILLIVDDIQAGCGRTGSFFSFEFAGIKPDMVCLSKSISGFGLPMSLLLIKAEYDRWAPAEDNGTFRGNTMAFVTARAALREYWSDNTLEQAILDKGRTIMAALHEMQAAWPNFVKQVRGRGMFCGIEFFDAGFAGEVTQACFEAKMIIERCGPKDEVIKIFPALTIDTAQLKQGLALIRTALKQCVYARNKHALHHSALTEQKDQQFFDSLAA